MKSEEYLSAFRNRSTALLVAAKAGAGLRVPSCPEWAMDDLVSHVGGVWGWSAGIVSTGKRTDFPSADEGVSGESLLQWAEQNARLCDEALSTAHPESDCWTFGLPRTRQFWFRRQALEATVHCWDAQNAVGAAEAIDPEVASDGVDEFLTLMLPRLLERNPGSWTGQSVHIHRTDGEGEWTVVLGPDTSVDIRHGHEKGDVALKGSASSLYLWCLNRAGTEDLEIFGDESIAKKWTSEVAF